MARLEYNQFMSNDNPYAAPQTSLSRVTSLNVPEGTDRDHFPETSTVELTRLANWDLAIGFMDMLWAVLFIIELLLLASTLRMNPYQWIWGTALLLSGLRVWGGSTRAKIAWGYNLLLDAVLLVALPWAIYLLTGLDQLSLLLVGPVLLLIGVICALSVVAHFAAKPLYGSYPQRLLNEEVRYRRRNHIE
jgi:hypothetical protein